MKIFFLSLFMKKWNRADGSTLAGMTMRSKRWVVQAVFPLWSMMAFAAFRSPLFFKILL